MSKVRLKIKISENHFIGLKLDAKKYNTSVDEAVEMALTDFWLKHMGINVISSDGIPEDDVKIIVVGCDIKNNIH
ncbi:MAG: hypothetical protein DRO40_05800 [Thermoprotei archaeon]|nr:MAG: hypothetical protein DRO40_05800 [Thermoprotei archaeon]